MQVCISEKGAPPLLRGYLFTRSALLRLIVLREGISKGHNRRSCEGTGRAGDRLPGDRPAPCIRNSSDLPQAAYCPPLLRVRSPFPAACGTLNETESIWGLVQASRPISILWKEFYIKNNMHGADSAVGMVLPHICTRIRSPCLYGRGYPVSCCEYSFYGVSTCAGLDLLQPESLAVRKQR